ncbi:MAG: hypothetical protein RLZZ387_1246 [Chloroflexota bacterium]
MNDIAAVLAGVAVLSATAGVFAGFVIGVMEFVTRPLWDRWKTPQQERKLVDQLQKGLAANTARFLEVQQECFGERAAAQERESALWEQLSEAQRNAQMWQRRALRFHSIYAEVAATIRDVAIDPRRSDESRWAAGRDWGMLACVECGKLKDLEAKRLRLLRCSACSRTHDQATEHQEPAAGAPPLAERRRTWRGVTAKTSFAESVRFWPSQSSLFIEG